MVFLIHVWFPRIQLSPVWENFPKGYQNIFVRKNLNTWVILTLLAQMMILTTLEKLKYSIKFLFLVSLMNNKQTN
jgi:hypothetical protein